MDSPDPQRRDDADVISRLGALASRLGIECLTLSPHELLFPHFPLGHTRACMDPQGEPVLRYYTNHRGLLGFGEIPSLSEFVNDWNHDCLSPRLVLNYASPEHVEIWGHTFLVVHQRPTAEQLEVSLSSGLSNAEAFLDALAEAFPLLHAAPTHSPDAVVPDEEAAAPESAPALVDVPRLELALPELGVTRFQVDGADAVYAWINDVFFAFVIDTGPSLVIKGHWDPDFPGSEFSKMFLTCNDWNRHNHSASAFCHSNVDGLQVRVDYPVMTAAGLREPQLLTALGRAIKHILHAIDDIAMEAVGASPVRWP